MSWPCSGSLNYQSLNMSVADAQLLESRKFELRDVAGAMEAPRRCLHSLAW